VRIEEVEPEAEPELFEPILEPESNLLPRSRKWKRNLFKSSGTLETLSST
jgi:hypothetical protein